MTRRSFTIEQVLTMLAATPTRIEALTAGLTSVQLRTQPNLDEWSANDVLAHLRACADVCGDPIYRYPTPIIPTYTLDHPVHFIGAWSSLAPYVTTLALAGSAGVVPKAERSERTGVQSALWA